MLCVVKPRMKSTRLNHLTLHPVDLLIFSLFLSVLAFAQEKDGKVSAADSWRVVDRNETPLMVASGSDLQTREYPYRSMAVHLLENIASDPKRGTTLALTLDARIQSAAESALATVGRGAVVVLDPRDGAILAMASAPSFDPTDPAKQGLEKDPLAPLTNRALSDFTPGATFVIATALAGLPKGLADVRLSCVDSQFGNERMRCWISGTENGTHGELDLTEALQVSCGAFFHQYGNRAGIGEITRIGRMLGLGEKSGLSVRNESAGLLPSPDWLRQVAPNEQWSDGYTANVAIGGGSVRVTPLQMASVVAAVGNGGQVWKPRLFRDQAPQLRADLRKAEGISSDGIQVIRRGLWEAVNGSGGTGQRAPVADVEVSGKTGTAQFSRKGANGESIRNNLAWFVGFAPSNKPRVAICVMVEGGTSGGSVAAPLASEIMTAALNPTNLPVLPTAPIKGNFEPIESPDCK